MPTTTRRHTLTLAGLEVPVVVVTGAGDGPRLVVLAGVHGCEYASMAAVRRWARGLEERELRGRVVAVPVLNLPAFRARTPFVVPDDGKNLNRCFPGDQAGTLGDRLAYAAFEEVFQGTRWAALTAQGAKPQRPLWASTGVKNPDYSDTMYVTELTVADTVNTMPEKTLLAFADHGGVDGDQVTGTAAQAQGVFDALEGVGVDLTDVFRTLEDEGVEKFEQSWRELLDTVKGQLDAAT